MPEKLFRRPSQPDRPYFDPKQYLADKLFPHVLSVSEIESHYPPRKLAEGAKVTRVAPSPTGPVHIGSLFVALISERLAHQTGGVFYVRIEDTDKAREVTGASQLIAKAPAEYGIKVDEGVTPWGQEGEYGPYIQSERVLIYQSYAKEMVTRGLAYPCFCTAEELEEITKRQTAENTNPGYYGKWALWRDAPINAIESELNQGTPFVIRLRSPGDPSKSLNFEDSIKGKMSLPENVQDIVLLKSDGLPTYHFAHVIDDHLMGTTDVIRGDEWVSSIARDVQLFEVMGWQAPRYGHIAPIQKMEGESRVKLSKRKHPEAGLSYYRQTGYPPAAVVEYLLNLANSNFENWRRNNPDADWRDFKLQLNGLNGKSGALMDENKLKSYSRDTMAKMDSLQLFTSYAAWAQEYDPELAAVVNSDRDYALAVMNIETSEGKKSKRMTTYPDFRKCYGFMFDEIYRPEPELMKEQLTLTQKNLTKKVITLFLSGYNETDSRETWLEKQYSICDILGYARNKKAFDAEPDRYEGHFGDIAAIYRVALAGENKSPDLFDVMKTMGKERVEHRLRVLQELYQ